MSYRKGKALSLAGLNYADISEKDLHELFLEILQNGIHGICYSSYTEDQRPGSKLSDEQIRSRLKIISPYIKWIRTFSCTDGGEKIPGIAKEFGLKVFAGAWLGDDEEKNEEEVANLEKIAAEGHVDMAAVGNEVLYRKEMDEPTLLSYLHRVKKTMPGIPTGYVDAYYEFVNRPAVTEACDIIYANCYPFWEGCHIDYSLLYMKDMYRYASNAAPGKKVVVSETGWPNKGTAFMASEPSLVNALRYFINAQKWSAEDNIEMFYFSSFDEVWKIATEGDVGAFWGLWDKDGNLKYGK